MSAWSPVLLLLLVVEGVFTHLFTPLPPLYEIGALHVARYLCGIACVILLPGWPVARLLLAGRSGSPIKVLGLGLVINALFLAVNIRTAGTLDRSLTPEELYWRIALITVAALVALWWVDRSHPLRVTRPMLVEAAVGVVMVVVFALANGAAVLGPDHRSFSHTSVDRFLIYNRAPGVSLKVVSGLTPRKAPRWNMVRARGHLRVSRKPGARAAFPLRLLFIWKRPATVRICDGHSPCRAIRVVAEEMPAGPAPYHRQTRISSRLVNIDVNPAVTDLHLIVDPAPSPGDPMLVEDYSNLKPEHRQALFFSLNNGGDAPMLGEAFELMDHSWDLPEFLLDHNDMLMGYLLYSVLELRGGRSLAQMNLFFLASVLLCFLMICEVIRDAWPGRGQLAFLFATIASMQVLVLMEGLNHAYLPDVLFTTLLLICISLLRRGHHWAFLLATVPAVLTRSTGALACGFMVLSALATDPPRRKVVKLGVLCLVVWVATFFLLTYQKYQSGHLGEAINMFLTYARAHDTTTTTSGALINAGRFLYKMTFYTSGMLLLMALPRGRTGVTLAVVTGLYSALLMFSSYQPYYRLVPVIYLCATGAGVNVLGLSQRWRRRVLPAALGASFVAFLLMLLFTGRSW